MRPVLLVPVFLVALIGSVLGPVLAGTYPAAGNISGLALQTKVPLSVGDDIGFTVTGTGSCSIVIMGIPNPILPILKASGPLPLTMHGSISQPGTYNVYLQVISDPTNPAWCSGNGSPATTATIVVKAQGQVTPAPTNAPQLIANAVGPLVLSTPKPTPAPTAAPPKITELQIVAAPPNARPRPNNNVFYAGENFQVDVSGTPTSANKNEWICGYTVELVQLSTGKIVSQSSYLGWMINDLGVVPAPGDYKVKVVPYVTPGGGDPPACLGGAERTVKFYPQAAWITGIELVGFGFHFNMADAMGLEQFCQACDSIFSPAHNSSFLAVIPTVLGSTAAALDTNSYNKNECDALVTFSGSNFGGNNPNGPYYIQYYNGQPGVPTKQKYLDQDSTAPYWTQWTGDTNSVKVTISPANEGQWGAPNCNILGGTISKSIVFTSNPSAPAVHR